MNYDFEMSRVDCTILFFFTHDTIAGYANKSVMVSLLFMKSWRNGTIRELLIEHVK